ncbi:polysaccharide pyruvyl transferase family protein [Paenibacillus chitinolyticus]|uniref:Polysaccharide pyruvyl transferase family protein n=1 Tax=Paenibacillus chitinolyticus TaxID=79263 RepID=A0A410X240_9BACL|nr:polysaccharide pyruvyl transferase family protein [Paenibacillus chitinolyticus]MCY9593506.1 polysaccharide pyruvyl transferase family protein [Paenibacillus chitinolyticus]MCY9597477.1 polysaccharide pyruvyl transferase family protein [Paenibacillus chitinolyticus]QAV20679.1 polysaccharide pyruvyl transferase family protein [Paenibacillus chitinolyticus]
MKHILLAGVPHSTNLGDGLIAMTVNQLIRTCGEYTVTNFDLTAGLYRETPVRSGSVQRSDGGPALTREYKLNEVSVKKKLTPDFLRYMKSYSVHKRKDAVLGEQIRELVTQADAVLIGGGHLFIDTYLSFPIAMRRLVREVKRQGKPLHVVFVGMRGPWSFLARKWFTDILHYAKTISVRDEDSLAYLLSIAPSLAHKAVALSDPALVTLEAFPGKRAAAIAKLPSVRTVGLGIMDPNEMRRHSSYVWERDDCADWWHSLAKGATDGGSRVRVFTNGADTDNAFVERYIKPRLAGMPGVEFAPYPGDVGDLVESIRDCDTVIAQRLHACIPAISFGKPTYGIAWDKKLASIFKDLGLSGHVLDFRTDPKAVLAGLVPEKSRQEGSVRIVNQKKRELVTYVGRILHEA